MFAFCAEALYDDHFAVVKFWVFDGKEGSFVELFITTSLMRLLFRAVLHYNYLYVQRELS